MKDIFAELYEYFVFDTNFLLIFNTLYEDGSYLFMGLTFIFVPFLLWLPFYYLWKYPYVKFFHWITWLLIIASLVFGFSWSIADNAINFSNNQDLIGALSDGNSGFQNYADSLLLKYALYNSFFSFLVGIIWSIIMIPFSKIQMYQGKFSPLRIYTTEDVKRNGERMKNVEPNMNEDPLFEPYVFHFHKGDYLKLKEGDDFINSHERLSRMIAESRMPSMPIDWCPPISVLSRLKDVIFKVTMTIAFHGGVPLYFLAFEYDEKKYQIRLCESLLKKAYLSQSKQNENSVPLNKPLKLLTRKNYSILGGFFLLIVILLSFARYRNGNSNIVTDNNTKKSELEYMKLYGKVKSENSIIYDVVENFGKITKGEISKKYEDFGFNFYSIYNKDGNKIETKIYKYDGSLKSKFTYRYDEKGNKIETNSYNSDGRFDFKYDEKGNEIEINSYNSDGSLYSKYTYKYDENGNEIERNKYNSDGNFDGKHTFQFDEKGNQIENNEYTSDGSLYSKYTYKYDENGNVIERNKYNSDGSLYSKDNHKYEFDKNNNWIKQVKYENTIPKYIIERTIEYYE